MQALSCPRKRLARLLGKGDGVLRCETLARLGDDRPHDPHSASPRTAVSHASHARATTYGPTADTGGLMQNHAPAIYAHSTLQALLEGEAEGGKKTPFPAPSGK